MEIAIFFLKNLLIEPLFQEVEGSTLEQYNRWPCLFFSIAEIVF